MAILSAYDILTDPNPTARGKLVVFLAEWCARRIKQRRYPKKDDVWYVVAIAMRWGAITRQEMPNFSRSAIGQLVEDVYAVWTIKIQEGI